MQYDNFFTKEEFEAGLKVAKISLGETIDGLTSFPRAEIFRCTTKFVIDNFKHTTIVWDQMHLQIY
jgi:hypothetical protein